MIRRALNIWRVYSDLMANFMGLVFFGGAGLMLMVGGAVVQAHPGAAANVPVCEGAGVFQKVTELRELRETPGMDKVAGRRDCTMPASRIDMIRFDTAAEEGDRQKIVEAVCRPAFRHLKTILDNRLKGAKLEFVGATSQKFDNTGQCKIPAPGKDDLRSRVLACKTCPPDILALANRSSSLPVVDEAQMADKFICNAPIAAKRAIWAYSVCLSVIRDSEGDTSVPKFRDFVDYSTIVAEPTPEGGRIICDTTKDPTCDQTVWLRIRLPPNAQAIPGARSPSTGPSPKPAAPA